MAIALGTPVDIAMYSALSRRDQEARELLRRGTTEPWFDIKQRVWERDNFTCQACGLDLTDYPDQLTVGHKIDKACGGSNREANLCLQCVRCNSRKPHHHTLSEYEECQERKVQRNG
jgi:5-methylcytosine-specific restriction endonuclease McrA